MADPITVIGLAASVSQLVLLGGQVVSRINEFNSRVDKIPKVFRDISLQLPCLIDICQKLDKDIDASDNVAAVVKGFLEHVRELHTLTEKLVPTSEDSRINRTKKAAQSIRYERRFLDAQRILESYKTSLILYYRPSLDAPKAPTARRPIFGRPPEPKTPSVSRHKLLRQIDLCLEGYADDYIGPRFAILLGMGGQGKSRLALDYCHKALRTFQYQSILWMDATSPKTMVRSFGDVADQMNVQKRTFVDEESRTTFVKESLIGTSWLLVFDNFDHPDRFENIDNFIPSGTGSILITSRHADAGAGRLGKVISISRMEECESLELLLYHTKYKLTDSAAQEEARAILAKLGHLPLAIVQAGAYISHQNLPLRSFLKHYESRKKMVLEQKHPFWDYRKKLHDEDKMETPVGVLTTWEMSFGRIGNGRNTRECVEHLLTVAAFLGNVDVGESLFRTYAEGPQVAPSWLQIFVADGKWDQYAFGDAVSELLRLSLVQSRSTEGDDYCLSLHPMIRDWLQERIGEEDQRKYVTEVIMILSNFIDSHAKELSHQVVREILEHLDACVCNEAKYLNPSHRLGFGPLRGPAITFSSYFLRYGRYREAEITLSSVLENDKERFGHGHVYTLTTARELANVYNHQGRYIDALNLLAPALEKCEKQFGIAHLETLRLLSGLGSVYVKQNRLAEAELLYERVLEGYKRSKLIDKSEVLLLFEYLAEVKRFLGKHNEANALYLMALDGYEKERGDDSSETSDMLRVIGGIADLIRSQRRYEEAEVWYERGWQGYKRLLGPDHPRTTKMLTNLAISCRNQEKYYKAERLLTEAAETFIKVLGRDHPETLRALNNLAICIDKQGYYQAAEVRYREVLKGRVARLGPDHHYTLRTMERLAHMLWLQDKRDEAEVLAAELLRMGGKLPKYDPLVTDRRAKYKALETLYLDAEQRYAVKFSWDHVDALETYECLSNILVEHGQHKRAAELRDLIKKAEAKAEVEKRAKAEAEKREAEKRASADRKQLGRVPGEPYADPLDHGGSTRQPLQIQLSISREDKTQNAFSLLWTELSTTAERILTNPMTSWMTVVLLVSVMAWPTLYRWLLGILPSQKE